MIDFFAQLKKNDFENVPTGVLNAGAVKSVLQIVFGIIGAVSIIILMLAALKYVTSRGEPTEVAKAKNTILYAVIGLAISMSAFVIVGFVIKEVSK